MLYSVNLTNYKMPFKDIFKDSNDYNEKSIAGFVALVVMILYSIADIVGSFINKSLTVNEVVYNSFVTVVLGAFLIGEAGKIFKKSDKNPEEKE